MMLARTLKPLTLALVLGAGACLCRGLYGQEAPAEQAAEAPPPVPKGVEVMARGPVHEAFANPTTTEPAPTPNVPKQPPKPINEVPPEDKPEGDVVWISGYWAWDDDRNDFLWVSGIWRAVPPGKQWVAGYWREDGDQWQWVAGFWTEAAAEEGAAKEVTYLPPPPRPPDIAPPGDPPTPESFYVPGLWMWNGETYAWRAGYWARVQPGYVWVPAHYQWTPSGCVYLAGYWDLAVARRGFLYAPVVIDYAVVGPTFVYTPAYAVRDTVVLDALFVRPSCGAYYFGDYYGPRYRTLGFESSVVYSRTHYDSIIVYERYERRSDPTWLNIQIDLTSRRDRGEVPLPPRTLAQQTTIVNNTIVNNVAVTNVGVTNVATTNIGTTNINQKVVNNNATVLMPTSKLAAEKKMQTVKLDQATRTQALEKSRAVQQVAVQRRQTEVASAGMPTKPRQASFKMPAVQPVRTPTEARAAAARTVTPARTGAAAARTMTPARTGAAAAARTMTPSHTGAAAPARTMAPPVHNAATPTRTMAPAAARTALPPARNTMPPARNVATPARNTAQPLRYGNTPAPRSTPPASRPIAPAARPPWPPQQRPVTPPYRPNTGPQARPPVQPYRQPPPSRQPPPRQPPDKKKPPYGN